MSHSEMVRDHFQPIGTKISCEVNLRLYHQGKVNVYPILNVLMTFQLNLDLIDSFRFIRSSFENLTSY